ncbi:hypothetical protein [Holdemania sp. Marseille-P2844]|uniref:hypothetical protein n=1 Tax=Holdemania sp. Marseille-P2844 TaxID=1852366 RepID=UPI0009330EB7|nr:hypothetical protein [Holdemania sp. Marseille-P2844]
MNVKHDLEVLIEKYKDKNFFTFEVNFVNMAKDCLREINRLERENIELRKQLKEHFDNPPLKLDEIELGMWVLDKKYNAYRLIADFEFEFESGRFYKRQVEE